MLRQFVNFLLDLRLVFEGVIKVLGFSVSMCASLLDFVFFFFTCLFFLLLFIIGFININDTELSVLVGSSTVHASVICDKQLKVGPATELKHLERIYLGLVHQ